MIETPRQLTLAEWDSRYEALQDSAFSEPPYGGRLSRHIQDGDYVLRKLRFDNSVAALNLWNFLLTENARLHAARSDGRKIVGTMKDLGTVPVMACAAPELVAFYPDGAWWLPCIMEMSDGLLGIADSLGIDDSFCPVRAMLGAFLTHAHFPIPDLLLCSAGATCDDFSAIAQRLEGMGYPITWWEIPHRRRPAPDEQQVSLPGCFKAAVEQVTFVQSELQRAKEALETLAGHQISESDLADSIEKTNRFRHSLAELRRLTFTAELCPMPALELLIAEMIALHFCSDQPEALTVINGLLDEVRQRIRARIGYFTRETVRVFWVNPVADIRAMNLLEECGGRICGSEYLFSHALDPIPTDLSPMEALARSALADPMVGDASDRAMRICEDISLFGSEALIISKIPGASHCALESSRISDIVSATLNIPVLEIEVPPLGEAMRPSLKTRIEGLMETVRHRSAGRGVHSDNAIGSAAG